MEYRYTPRAKNKLAICLVVSLGAASLFCLLFGMVNLLSLRTLWHSLLLVLLVSDLYLYLRFCATSYCYLITDEWGEPTLVVTQLQGKRASTACRLSLCRLLSLDEVDAEEKESARRTLAAFRAERHRYSYLATLRAGKTQILYGHEGGVRFAIRLEGDDAFVAALRAAHADALVRFRTEGDESD